jgi:hypothetical protein
MKLIYIVYWNCVTIVFNILVSKLMAYYVADLGCILQAAIGIQFCEWLFFHT